MKSNLFNKTMVAIALINVIVILFCIFFKPVYGNCHMTIEGKVCKLIKWERR